MRIQTNIFFNFIYKTQPFYYYLVKGDDKMAILIFVLCVVISFTGLAVCEYINTIKIKELEKKLEDIKKNDGTH